MVGEAAIEQALEKSLMTKDSEKSYLDKVYGRKDIEDIRKLMTKEHLNREDVNKLLDLMAGQEAKLVNMGAYERYVILKFYAWIADICRKAQYLYDYEEDVVNGKVGLDQDTKRLFETAKFRLEYAIKYLVEVYLNINRTSLSLGGTGFSSGIETKWDITYNQAGLSQGKENSKG